MIKRVSIPFFTALLFLVANTGMARESGLPDFTALVDQAGPAVVNIRVTQFGQRARSDDSSTQNQNPQDQEQMPEFFRRFFDLPNNPNYGVPDREGTGSGFIFESDGYIITNHHVIENADEIIVRLADRREFKAKLMGSDPQSDVALLKIDATGLPTLKFGDSTKLRRGEWVVAIGSPFNFDQSVTAGIVSAKGRSNNEQQYVPFIQTDAAINPGNSGGPLLNMDGEVVGVNSWILSASGGYMGLSFSIPIETVQDAVTQLREHGKVERGLLGVQVGRVSRELAEALKLDRPIGALVNDVTKGSAADKAGIQPGDVILSFNGEAIESWSDLPPLVGSNPPGTKAKVVVSRDGKEKTFEVTLDELQSDQAGNVLPASQQEGQSNVLGLLVESIPEDRRHALGDPEGGVLISRVQSDEAYRAGLRAGDIILMINSESVDNVKSFENIVASIKPGKAVALRVMRDGSTRFIAYTPTVED